MRARGFALGGSLDNAIVVDGDKILNQGLLRDREEFALHKAADLIGDLALLGAPVLALVKAHKSGHDLNTRLAKLLHESGDDGQRAMGNGT
jgi:UDP-3-O-[3-hydroxymyristoyl] N-acetylglucosamine deacetylase